MIVRILKISYVHVNQIFFSGSAMMEVVKELLWLLQQPPVLPSNTKPNLWHSTVEEDMNQAWRLCRGISAIKKSCGSNGNQTTRRNLPNYVNQQTTGTTKPRKHRNYQTTKLWKLPNYGNYQSTETPKLRKQPNYRNYQMQTTRYKLPDSNHQMETTRQELPNKDFPPRNLVMGGIL